ncbi:MAG TPA: TolC family protein [Terriglobales bacterium]|nr:TolC family protein [Terriglobales bacterium]
MHSHRWLLLAGLATTLAGAQGLPPAQMTPPAQVQLPLPPASAADAAGGVAPAAPAAAPLALSLDEAIARGLRQNLAPLLAQSMTQQARAQRLEAIAALLPRVDASAGELRQKVNLAAFGLSVPGIPQIVGPFNVFQASATASVPLLNLSAVQQARAARGVESAAHDDYQATRNLVVLAVANQYLLSVADQSRVQAAQAELATAQSALTQAQDMLRAGTVDRLAVVRAQVQRDRQQQQLTAAVNTLAKQRLQLARAIGLPLDQAFTLASTTPFAALAPPTPAAAVAEALATRPDFRAAQTLVRSAQLLVAAARDQHLPTVSVNGGYGTIGHELDSNHPVFSVGATIDLPVFAGGLTTAHVIAAQAQLHDAQNRAADLRAAIAVQVRSALLDLENNRAQVGVARDARDLAQQELTLSQDRFRAGVADNLEVVQAQQAVADANESYIASLYGYNLAKASLAQALGVAASQYRNYLPIL